MSAPLTYSPPGMKKLVPAIRSSSSRMPPASKTGNESSASTAVVNHAQQVIGILIRDIPRVRMFSSVVIKLSAPSSDPTQKIAMLIIHRFTPAPWPGPATLPNALNGAYPVQPPIGPTVPLPAAKDSPNFENHAPTVTLPSAKIAVSNTMNPTNVTQNDIMLRNGKAMSSAPI